MRIFLNGLGASAGAGLTYLYNVVPRLSQMPNVQTTVALQPHLRSEFKGYARTCLLDAEPPSAAAERFWFEQVRLPVLIRETGASLLISAGNFALRSSPVPQILLSGNSLYTSPDFSRDLRTRHSFRIWLDTRVRGVFAKRSVHWADCTVAPSQAFAAELRRWTGKDITAIHHGFNPDIFFADNSPLPQTVQKNLACAEACMRLLFVSHYNYYRNFETLFRAVAILRDRLPDRKVRLFLTCRLKDGQNPGIYKTAAAANLITKLGIQNNVVELGPIPYHLLHQVYRTCDIYVTPAYTETFAHPLVEAMASALPIVASDLEVHREICGQALFFEPFSAEGLAARVMELVHDESLCQRLSAHGLLRSREFSWDDHVDQLVDLGEKLCRR